MKRGGNAATITESEAPQPTKRMRGFVVNALSVAMHHASERTAFLARPRLNHPPAPRPFMQISIDVH